jgi:environmental stress-induced protein Ves
VPRRSPRFPGFDRHIALLDGAGFTMTLDDGGTHALTTPFKPFAFAGERKVAVTLADGPTRDFNLMVRRAKARGEVVTLRESGTHRLDPDIVLVYAARGDIDTSDGVLQAGDAWLPCIPNGRVTLHGDAVALAIRIQCTA